MAKKVWSLSSGPCAYLPVSAPHDDYVIKRVENAPDIGKEKLIITNVSSDMNKEPSTYFTHGKEARGYQDNINHLHSTVLQSVVSIGTTVVHMYHDAYLPILKYFIWTCIHFN